MKAIEEKSPPTSRLANKAEVAEFFEVHISTLDAWIRRQCPYIQRGSRGVSWQFDLLDVAKWRYGSVDSADEDDPEKLPPKERLDYYRGTRERDALSRDRGELIPFDLLDQLLGTAFTEIRAGLLSQHNNVASQYPEIPPDAIRWILSANRELLGRLAQTRLPESVESALDALVEPPGAATGSDGEPMGG